MDFHKPRLWIGESWDCFHIYAPYPLLHPRSLLIREVYQFEYLGLLLDPKLSMHLAALNAITKAAKGHALTQSVSYSMRYDRKQSQLSPIQSLGLWKSVVLPHFLQNLRYIHRESDLAKMQTSLNKSLARTLHVYGHHTALLADTGIPPLYLTRMVHLAQLHFRLSKTHTLTIPGLLFSRSTSSTFL